MIRPAGRAGPYREPVPPRQAPTPPPMPPPPRPKKVRARAAHGAPAGVPGFGILGAIAGALLMCGVALLVYMALEGRLGLVHRAGDRDGVLTRALAVTVGMALSGLVIGHLATRPLRQALASSGLFLLLLGPWPLFWKGGGHAVLALALVVGLTLSVALALRAARQREKPRYPGANHAP